MAKKKRLKAELLQYIEMLEPNERIPSRNFICNKWRISRSTADAIVSELQREGKVYCIKGSGTFVAPQAGGDDEHVDMTRPYSWAVIVPDLSFSLYPKAFSGISAFAQAHNIDFIVCCTNESADTEYALMQRMVATGIDGLIIVPAMTTTGNERNYNYLQRSGVPFVFWQRSVDYMRDVPQILLNGYHGGYIAAKHLIDNGYRRICYLARERFRSSMDRFMGYCAALSEAGIEFDPSLVKIGISADEENSCIMNMLSADKPADSFVCFVDDLAVGVVKAINACGLRISDDVGVIGFEGIITRLDSTLDVRLTYVDISYEQSGDAAANTLWKMMRSAKPSTNFFQVFSPKLVVRDSCKGKINKSDGGELL